MKKFIIIILINLFFSVPSKACFGPELIIGYQQDSQEHYISAILLELYIKEKTGVGAKIQQVSNNNILILLKEEKVDIILYEGSLNFNNLTKKEMTNDKKLFLYYRTKIKEDLRFTTVMEAIDRLSKHLNSDDIFRLTQKIGNQKQERRIIKEFLMQRGLW
ncbi:MAG: hypothetical protein N2202_06045 [Proteobacteria bacterium]|nr:hypothetical protein [Pseudomonadota bacterium]